MLMKEEYPFLFGRLGKNLNTHTLYIYKLILEFYICLWNVWTTCGLLPTKNILAYVTHRNLCQINQNCRKIHNLRDVLRIYHVLEKFFAVWCLLHHAGPGVQCPPGIGWSFQEHGWPWKPSSGEQSSNLNQTWHFKRINFQQFCLVVEPPCLKHMLVNKLKKHLWKKKTPFFVHSSWTTFSTHFHTTRFFNPFRPIWMNSSRQTNGCRMSFINTFCFCGGSNNLSFLPESKTCKYWSVSSTNSYPTPFKTRLRLGKWPPSICQQKNKKTHRLPTIQFQGAATHTHTHTKSRISRSYVGFCPHIPSIKTDFCFFPGLESSVVESTTSSKPKRQCSDIQSWTSWAFWDRMVSGCEYVLKCSVKIHD